VLRGALDMGLVLPAGFDRQLQAGSAADVDVLVWGESLLRDRATLGLALSRQIIDLAGREIPIETQVSLLGEGASVPWDTRLFPMVVAMTIILGGTMVPATSIVDEKQKRTLVALTITPASLGEALTAKAIAGGFVSLTMGVTILAINRAFGAQPGLMVLLVALSAMLSATVGVIVGSLVNDITTLFTVMKSLGIVLYAPALLYLFPEVPGWVARIFPTYYMIGPIVDMSLHGAGWRDIAVDVYVLVGLIVLTVLLAGQVVKRRQILRPG
jgi:ABC-2 type transport system permease protein